MTVEPPPVYVINRAVDEERLAGFAAAASAEGVGFERIEAIDGHDPLAPLFLYRRLVRDAFWDGDRIKPGALACAASHMAAWRRMLADGAEAALICEDDARIVAGPEALAAAAAAASGADVVFVNDRATDWRAAGAASGDAEDDMDLRSAPALAAAMAASGARPGAGGLAPAPGADAYLVTRRGAERLLALLDRVGLVAGVDWLILAAGLGGPAEALADAAALAGRLEGAGPLDVRIAAAPLAAAAPGPSALRHGETAPLAALRDTASVNRPGVGARSLAGMPDDPVGAAFAGGRFYEEPALAMMARWMPRGGTFADVGAHVGGHTIFMLIHGGAGRAVPFEHNAAAIRVFGEMIAVNRLGHRVDDEALGFGLAEEVGRRERRGSPRRPFGNRLKRGFDEGVRVRPGDALIRGAEIAMVKIDVNGEEREVIKGLRKTLSRQNPLLVVDMTRPRSQKAEPLIARLHYREVERAVWDEDGLPRDIRLYRRDPP